MSTTTTPASVEGTNVVMLQAPTLQWALKRTLLGIGVLRVRAHERGKPRAHGVETALEHPAEEGDRVGLQLGAKVGLDAEDRAWTGPEGAVVQEDEVRVERPGVGVRGARRPARGPRLDPRVSRRRHWPRVRSRLDAVRDRDPHLRVRRPRARAGPGERVHPFSGHAA
jgi:hypothetical protein